MMIIILISLLSYCIIHRFANYLPCYLKQQWQAEYQLLNQTHFFDLCRFKKNYFFLFLTCYFNFFTILNQHTAALTLVILIFNWILLCLSEIDWYNGLLPDQLTLFLLWCGLLINLNHTFIDSASSILGAAAGYSSLWLFNQLFFFITKRQGMGYGDFKLVAAIGAWLGWQALPLIVGSASILACIFSLFLSLKQKKICQSLAFGPFLSFSAMAVMLSILHQNQWNLFL